MKTLIKILCLSVLWFSCESDVQGCTDSDACNFNSNATTDDNTCFYADDWEDECGVCDLIPSNDNATCEQDECGIWGGDGQSCGANLIGNWNYLTASVTITDIDGQITEDVTEYDQENSIDLTFNEDGTWNQSILENDNVINYSGTWSADGFVLIMINDYIPIESEREYTFSNNSNTLSMFYSQTAIDADGNIFATYDVVLELERIN